MEDTSSNKSSFGAISQKEPLDSVTLIKNKFGLKLPIDTLSLNVEGLERELDYITSDKQINLPDSTILEQFPIGVKYLSQAYLETLSKILLLTNHANFLKDLRSSFESKRPYLFLQTLDCEDAFNKNSKVVSISLSYPSQKVQNSRDEIIYSLQNSVYNLLQACAEHNLIELSKIVLNQISKSKFLLSCNHNGRLENRHNEYINAF